VLAADTENNRRKCKAVYQQLVRLMFAFNGSAAADGLLDAETVIAWTDEVESDLRKAANAAAGQSAVPIVNAEVEDLEAAAA
jgi:recombinational DNA repair protein (RecF pathway)